MEDVHDDLLVESNNVNVTNNMNVAEDEMLGGDGGIVPKVGMMFMDEKGTFEKFKLKKCRTELQEIELLESWIELGKSDSGSNALSLSPLPEKRRIGKLPDGSFSRYAGVEKFSQLPLSKRTKDGLAEPKYSRMTDIQRASLPHSLCCLDILGAGKNGSGKTLTFMIPVLEELYKARWGPEDGVGCIIMSPTRELAGQLFEVLKSIGRHHGFSAGLLIGGRKDVDTEKERVNELNILVCTPGRLLQHMDETPNFDCSQLLVFFCSLAFFRCNYFFGILLFTVVYLSVFVINHINCGEYGDRVDLYFL